MAAIISAGSPVVMAPHLKQKHDHVKFKQWLMNESSASTVGGRSLSSASKTLRLSANDWRVDDDAETRLHPWSDDEEDSQSDNPAKYSILRFIREILEFIKDWGAWLMGPMVVRGF